MENNRDEYVLDTAYTWGFYEGQGPMLMSYVARLNGVDVRPLDRPFRYLELGCGNGVTSNILASVFPHAEFHAVDLNPEHIANGRTTSVNGGLDNITFHATSFEDLLAQDLGEFDFISAHGVYSWIGAEVRRDLLKVLDKCLRPGGLCYLSYNTMPGWAALTPVREIMLSYTSRMKGTSVERATEGLRYLRFLRENKAAYFSQYPSTGQLVDTLLATDRKYVVHEYFNEAWQPLYFSQVAEDMASVNMKYCGTTALPRNYINLCVPEEFQSLLLTADDDVVRETHKSLILNERFRTDVFCKDAQFTPIGERYKLFRDMRCTTAIAEPEIQRKLQVGAAAVSYSGEIYDALIPALVAGDKTVSELLESEQLERYSESYTIEAINNLVPSRQFHVQYQSTPANYTQPLDEFRLGSALNRELLRSRLLEDGVTYLGSPVLGTGIRIELLPGLLVSAVDEVGRKDAVERAAAMLTESGKVVEVDGKAVTDPGQCKVLLEQELNAMAEKSIPLLRKFGVIEPVA